MYYIIFCIEKNREHLWTICTLIFFTPPPKIVDNSDFELLKYLPPPGVPEYNIPPFDPWYAEEVNQVRSGYKLKLKHAKEAGWQQSSITKFRWDNYVPNTNFLPILLKKKKKLAQTGTWSHYNHLY